MNFNNAIPSNNGKPPGGIHNFDTAEPAPEFSPVPPGVYVAVVVHGELVQTRSGNDGYRVRFEVAEGPRAGRPVFRTWTFSERAMPYTKRDLALFGLTSSAKLLSPFPEPGREYRVRLVVALQRGDDGREFNDVKRIELLAVTESPAAAFVIPPPPTAQPEKDEGDTPAGTLFNRPGMLPD
jgi:hypothetical protein